MAIPESPWTRTEQYLDAIARGSSGGGSLPAVTAEDNGNVLTVVDGAWGKAAPSGGGNAVIVNVISRDDADEPDMTIEEILAIDPTGGHVLFKYADVFAHQAYLDYDENDNPYFWIEIQSVSTNPNTIRSNVYTYDSTGFNWVESESWSIQL